MNLREAFGAKENHFKLVKENAKAVLENREKILKKFGQITHEEIAVALSETVVQKVTPLAHLSYPEQLKQKHEWLENVL